MQEQVFDPIGMDSTTVSFDEAITTGNYGIPHVQDLAFEYSPGPIQVEQSFLPPLAPAGGAWSNVLDMTRYLITELNEGVAPDGTRVVSRENLGRTWEPQVAITDEASYGLGWIVDEYKELPMLHHGGNTFGFTSDLAFLPETGLGISVLTNQYGSFLNQLVRFRLLELMYEQEHEADEMARFQVDLIEESLAELLAQIQESVDSELIAPYLGRYGNEALGGVTVEWQEDELLFDAGEFQGEIRSRIDDEGELSYVLYESILAGLGIEFEGAGEGDPAMTIGSGVNEYTFKQVD